MGTRNMMLKILVEGETEKQFVQLKLAPYLMSLGYSVVQPVVNLTSIGFRGGISSYGQFKTNILRLQQRQTPCLISTMIDLFRLPQAFLGVDNSFGFSDGWKYVHAVEERLKDDIVVSEPTYFVPYVQLHEFEALLFSDISAVSSVLQDKMSEGGLKKLREIMKIYGGPEDINTGEGPSYKLLQITNNTYHKVYDGLLIADKIPLDKIRCECPHFNEWMVILEDFVRGHCL